MKIFKYRTAVIFLITAVITFNANAQPGGREYVSGRYFISIDDNAVPVTNVSYLDSVGTDFAIAHIVSFDMGPTDEKSTMDLVNKIQSAYQKKTLVQCVLSAADFDYNVNWERVYDEATIRDISLDNLDGSSKEAFNIHVRFSSASMRIKQGGGKYKSAAIGAKIKRMLCSNFKLSLGSLPSDKISSISNLKITAQDEYTTIYLKISPAQAGQWYDEMVANAQGQKPFSGVITLLAPDMKGELLKINLMNVQIGSYGSTLSTGDNIPRVTIGLRLNDIHF